MKRKTILAIIYFSILPLTVFILIIYSLILLHENSNNVKTSLSILRKNVEFKALPEERTKTEVVFAEEDIRVEILRDFFTYYNSPLLFYANDIVDAADRHNLDFRLLPAIAMQESNLCKKIPENSYNCWGFGIYGKKITKFVDYSEAIETISKTLAKEYVQKGYEIPEDIMKKYTPSSNGSWANGVAFFMNKLKVQAL